MFIGDRMIELMGFLGYSVEDVARRSFVDKTTIEGISKNEISVEEIDNFELALICSTLHCDEDYFLKGKTESSFMPFVDKRLDTPKSISVKAQVYDYMQDFSFVKETLAEA